MASGPSPALLGDPRFEDLIAKACRQQGLAPEFDEPVRQLVTGTADPRSFPCCNSGCKPCSMDYLRAAEAALKTLAEPPRSPSWWRRLLGRGR